MNHTRVKHLLKIFKKISSNTNLFYVRIYLGDSMNCNCRYCGAALPTSGGHCPNCGRMIPMDQQQMLRSMIDPKWNMYKNQDTAMYKKESNNKDEKIGKAIAFILLVLVVIIILLIIKGMN